MWRSLFLALGVSCCILGAEALAVSKAIVHTSKGVREIIPPEWAPWSLMAGGAVVVIYSFTIPARMNG